MAQDKLFYDDEYEALQLMISDSGKSAKEVANFLFPHMKPDSAYARLKACLNAERDERLTFGQIVAAMRFCDSFHPLMYACDETLHARPTRVAPSDEEARLVAAVESAAEVMSKAMAQINALRVRTGR